jgi:hypothetical protein
MIDYDAFDRIKNGMVLDHYYGAIYNESSSEQDDDYYRENITNSRSKNNQIIKSSLNDNKKNYSIDFLSNYNQKTLSNIAKNKSQPEKNVVYIFNDFEFDETDEYESMIICFKHIYNNFFNGLKILDLS